MFSQKDVRVFLKAYNDRGDSLKQGITHILMKEKDVCNELRSIFATWKIISIEIDQTKELVKTIVEGLQEKRGKNIVTVDLSQTSGAICQYMVICEGNTPTQVSALSDSVWDFARKNANEKPLSIDGTQGAQWIGMDYGTVLVHIFLPEQRAFYNLENLWADSKVIQVPNID